MEANPGMPIENVMQQVSRIAIETGIGGGIIGPEAAATMESTGNIRSLETALAGEQKLDSLSASQVGQVKAALNILRSQMSAEEMNLRYPLIVEAAEQNQDRLITTPSKTASTVSEILRRFTPEGLGPEE
jgi:hypothetical protein